MLSAIKTTTVAYFRQLGRGGDSLLINVHDPEALQVVNNRKNSVLITSYKAAPTHLDKCIDNHPLVIVRRL